MRHLNPELIDLQLRQVNKQRAKDGRPELLYMIPYQYIVEAKHDSGQGSEFNKSVDENNQLRRDFRYFVFIRSSEKDLKRLVQEDWNRNGRVRLHFYSSRDGMPLRVKADEMDRLISLFIDQRQKFNFIQSNDDFKLSEQVRLKTGVFKDYQFSVTKINHSGKGVNLTLALPIFNGEFLLQMEECPVADVDMPTRLQHYLAPDFLRVVERDLLSILNHRVSGYRKATANAAEDDSDKLNTYGILNYLDYENTAEHNHLRTLMLLCASLRKDKYGVLTLVPVIERQLSSIKTLSNDEEAFMMAVLFVATHEIAYRKVLREYEQMHETISEPLSMLMSIKEKIRVRKNKAKKNRKLDKITTGQNKLVLVAIRNCDISNLSPQTADAVGDLLVLNQSSWPEASSLSNQLVEVVKGHFKVAKEFDDKMRWLETLYRLSGVFSPLMHSNAELEKECDIFFDNLLAQHKDALKDALCCYRLHHNPLYQEPFDKSMRSNIIQSCTQWLRDLVEGEPKFWYDLPFVERLHRLWVISALNIRSWPELDNGFLDDDCWDNVLECFDRCHLQLLRLHQPDAETLTAYYHALALLYPDCKDAGSEDLYEEFFDCAIMKYSKVSPDSTEWWQLKAILEQYRSMNSK